MYLCSYLIICLTFITTHINMPGGWLDNIKENISSIVSLGEDKNYDPDYVKLEDSRTKDYLGRKINPNKDLYSGWYNKDAIKDLTKAAINNNYDPYTALSVGLVETGLGNGIKGGNNILRISQDTWKAKHLNEDTDPIDAGIKLLQEKSNIAKKLGYNDELHQLQSYNGLGKIGKNTEINFLPNGQVAEDSEPLHKSFYGIDVTKNSIDLKQNPIYGKKVIDARDNVIKKNPEIQRLIEGALNEKNPTRNYKPNWLNEAVTDNTKVNWLDK